MTRNNWMTHALGLRGTLLARAVTVAILLSFASPSAAEVHSLGYSFVRDDGGGIAVVRIDTDTGKFVDDLVLLESKDCKNAKKLRYDAAREQYLLTNATDKKSGPHLFLVPSGEGRRAREVKLPAMPDEIRLANGFALLTCGEDWLVQVELDSGQISGKWDSDLFDPRANGPEDIRFLTDGETVVVSFQKDSSKGKKKGSRIAALRWPDMKVIADSLLPRTRPDLHIKGNKKERGPGAEVVYLDEAGNRIIVTLDLYGAVAMADLSTFLAGNDVPWKYLSTAVDESWGNSFPDRMSALHYDGKQMVIVANAGVDGGIVLVDLAAREIAWRHAAPPGLETPIFLASESKAFSVCSGKRKTRGRRETEKTYLPQPGVYVVDFAVADSQQPRFDRIPTEEYMFRIARVGTVEKPWIVLAGGLGSPDTLMILNPRTGKIVDERPAIGALMRFEQE